MQSNLLYIEELEELFFDVQTQRIFSDQKVFTDCVPRFTAAEIVHKYRLQKNDADFHLLTFLQETFFLPESLKLASDQQTTTVLEHINNLWDKLIRETIEEYSSQINLPFKFIVPGGRFRELFYWDSYFTMLGLQVSGRTDLIEDMVNNFAFLINEYGFIPNGNRSYFLSRSQPPFFSLMIELLVEEKGEMNLIRYLPELKKEYKFWMQGSEELNPGTNAIAHTVRLPGGEILNRYWDNLNTPRPEGYYEDLEIYSNTVGEKDDLYRNIRAACASGWDFSGRWFENPQDMASIKTIDLIPVDLNCLLWHLEYTIAKASKFAGFYDEHLIFIQKANDRLAAIKKYLWNNQTELYLDYDFKKGQSSQTPSLATMFPLFFGIATKIEATSVIKHIEQDFLKPGGLITTLLSTGQQWDAPNGWAPLQWIALLGVKNYGADALAKNISQNWLSTVDRVFHKTGKIMEKYNVTDVSLEAGGGEYPNQDGFGWTNGVYLKMNAEQLNLININLKTTNMTENNPL
ncbi:alpha,alpha-trehalase TreF [Pedobacter punctiformis]|uniref:Alpha,alpha-trehalase TreF n=1 Tax=Pedobacter punctiformis TaxID=3004097 RepID=A0ABT4LB69_9SPHI|nr:alpha,alpha-trehalase TreF [Pedobacter sp. HCMS5-2]MCZ4245160.1 alpha,alpha-trehalase TreF [Pedobacter sp. HCMS5-2]